MANLKSAAKVHSILCSRYICSFFSNFNDQILIATVESTKTRRRHKQPKSDADIDQDSQVITLTDLNAKSVLSTRNVDIFVEFYAPWCVHCQQLKPELRSTANAFKNVSFCTLLVKFIRSHKLICIVLS